ncbi:glutathione S-transferase family protein [Falsiroseomonas sp. HC035]|uniref:glutathione S-transferase family protein n=1 Tax=Falsiroseomonas sp. HC035 TaxID=3390999 RepID=UPI003D3202DE
MKYILYGDKGSGSGPVEMALAEAGAEVELREVPLEGDHQRRADYLELNPMGRLPTLVLPGGMVMTESLAILVTLADLHPEAGLLPPPGDLGRATALRWMALLAGEFYPHVTRYDYPERFGIGPDQAQPVKWRAQEMGQEVLGVIERHAGLTGDAAAPFLLGERFSVADLYLAVLSRWMGGRVWTPENLPKLEVLARAVAVRPAVAPVWDRHGLG